MSSFNFSLYDPSMIESGQQTTQPVSKSEPKQESTFDFGMYDENQPTGIKEPESWGKWIARTIYQIPAGMMQVATWPMDIIAIMGAADATDPEEIEHIRRISEREGIPFDEEKYMAAVQQAQEIFPTQRNIEAGIESKTGLPLTPQDRFQKGLRYLSTVGTALPNQPFGIRGTNINVSKPLATGTVSAVKETAQTLGVPEPVAELTAPFVLKAPMTNQPVATGIGKKTKPSGMKELIFEQSPAREVSESRFQKINQALEDDFRGLLNVIEQEGPISQTRLNLQTDPGYKAKILDTFEDVRQLAIGLPEKHNTDIIRAQLASKLKTKTKTRMTPTEYENSYDYHMNKLIKETPKKEVFAEDLVEQYRRNNRSLSEIYEKDKSSGFNRGKKDALLDYNRTLAEYIEKRYPKSAFSNLFKETNKQWTQIKDAEFIDAYLDKLFEGKINYKHAEKAFDKNLEEPFRRALGKEGFEDFKTLMKDLYSTKEAMGRLKIAKDLGFTDLAKMGGLFFTAPAAAKLKFGADTLKNMYKTLLDKPRLGITWKEANDAFKKGDFEQAQAKMTILTDELEKAQAAPKPTTTININNPISTSTRATAQPRAKSSPQISSPTKPQNQTKSNISNPSVSKSKADNIEELFGGMGKVISESFYDTVWDALSTGKPNSSLKNVNFFISAKYNKDSGRIKSKDDLKRFGEFYFNKDKTQPTNPKPIQETPPSQPIKPTIDQIKQLEQKTKQPRKQDLTIKTPDVIELPFSESPKGTKGNIFDRFVKGENVSKSDLSNLKDTRVSLLNTRKSNQQFHGTKNPIKEMTNEIYDVSNPQNVYGAGFYTTDALDIASGYAGNRSAAPRWLQEKLGLPQKSFVYMIKEKSPQNLFDMEKPLTKFKKIWNESQEKAFKYLQEKKPNEKTIAYTKNGRLNTKLNKDLTFDEFDNSVISEVIKKRNPKNLRQLYDDIRDYFEGEPVENMSYEFEQIHNVLEKNGYDGLTHKGGLLTNNPEHQVKIYWKPQNLEVDEFKYPKGFEKTDRSSAQIKSKVSSVENNKQLKKTSPKTKTANKKADTLPKVDKKIENVERQDISVKGLKQQKDYLINALENAIKNPSSAEKINIKIPGDGEFTLNNKQDVLEKVLKKVEKNWPTSRSINAPYIKHKPIARNPEVLKKTRINP